MTFFTIVLILSICAPITIVHCQGGGHVLFHWFIRDYRPLNVDRKTTEIGSYSDNYQTISLISTSISETNKDRVSTLDEEEPTNQPAYIQDVFYDVLPSDRAYDAEQSPFRADGVFETPVASIEKSVTQEPERNVESCDTLSDDEIEVETSSADSSEESSNAESSSETRKRVQEQVNEEFMKHFGPILHLLSSDGTSVEDSSGEEPSKEEIIEPKSEKKEPTEDKFTGKKYTDVKLKGPADSQKPEDNVELPSTESTDNLSGDENADEISISTNSSETSYSDLLSDEFIRRIFRIWNLPSTASEDNSSQEESTETELIEEESTKKEPTENKFKGKKYAEIEIKKPLGMQKQRSLWVNLDSTIPDEVSTSDTNESDLQEETSTEYSSETQSWEASTQVEHEQSSMEIDSLTSSYVSSDSQSTQSDQDITSTEQFSSASTSSMMTSSSQSSDASVSSTDYQGLEEEVEFKDEDFYFIDPITPTPPMQSPIVDDETTESKETSISDFSQLSDKKEESEEKNAKENIEDSVQSSESKKETVETESTAQGRNSISDETMAKENEIPNKAETDKSVGRLSLTKIFRAILNAMVNV